MTKAVETPKDDEMQNTWQLAKFLEKRIYHLTKTLPDDKQVAFWNAAKDFINVCRK